VASILGALAGGWVSDWLTRRRGRDAKLLVLAVTAAVCIPVRLLYPIMPSRELAIGLAFVAVALVAVPYGVAETLTSTHYFWGMARNFRLDYESFSEQLLVTGMTVFNDEDKPVIEAQQRAIGASDKLFDMKPALLQTDRAAVRARRMLERMIRQETGGMFDSSAIDIERP